MASNIDLSALTPSQRRDEIVHLVESRLLTAGHITRLAAQRDEISLLLIKERYERYGQLGFEYYMARYELERKSELSVRISLLEEMMKTSFDQSYLLELAGLYCALADALQKTDSAQARRAATKAKRTCIRLRDYYKDGRVVEESRKLLALLDAGEVAKGAKAYSDYAAPVPTAAAKAGPKHTEAVKVAVTQKKEQPEPAPAQVKPAPKKTTLPAAPKLREAKEVEIPPAVEKAFRGLIGMKDIKNAVSKIYWSIYAQRQREKKCGVASAPVECNFLLLGNPGTGKTEVARRMGKLLYELGVRKENKVIEVSREKLIDTYIGGTEEKTKEYLAKAEGGVLFVDEAYTLYKKDSPRDFGAEALNAIMKHMEDHRDNLTVVFAGYQTEMDEMLREANPGLASRFQYRIILPDYTDQELLQIAYGFTREKGLILDQKAEAAFLRQVERQRVGDKFGNARTVRSIIDKAVGAQAARIGPRGDSVSEFELRNLTAQDFESTDTGKENLEELLAQLDRMVGLKKAKEQVRALVKAAQAQQQLQDEGREISVIPDLNTAFLGNPGTGKTTMAKLLGRICRSLGILKRGEIFVEAKREDLVGDGQTSAAEATKKKLQEAMGGILFIDEAYSLYSGEGDKAGKEAIACLIAEMENHRKDLMVIVAGYTKEMDEFFSVNTGFRSRVSNRIEFEDYTTDQLMDIFQDFLKADQFTLEEGWREKLEPVLASRIAQQGMAKFGNARGVRNLANEARQHWVDRGAVGTQITLEDLTWETVDHESAEQLLEKLNELEGLESVKRQVRRIISTIQSYERDRARGIKRKELGSQHMIFSGNPGTGKTTVAELIGRLYTALGVLPGGPVKTCTRKDLVAEYQGQTDKKVQKAIEEAMGGVLFIDEAYALCRDTHDTFGLEAIDTLVPALETYRSSLMVILAGYPDKMEEFLSRNPGLKSRFPHVLTFEDYNTDQLLHIFQRMVEKEGFVLAEGWQGVVAPQFDIFRAQSGDNFGNARDARNAADKAISQRDERTVGLELDDEALRRIELCDLQELLSDGPVAG